MNSTIISQLCAFHKLSPQDYKNAILTCIQEAKTGIELLLSPHRLEANSDLIQALEDLQHKLDRTFAPLSHLQAVSSDDATRKAYKVALEAITEFNTWRSQYLPLYRAMQLLASKDSLKQAPYARLIHLEKQAFELSGAHKEQALREQVAAAKMQLSKLSETFENNVMDCQDSWQWSCEDPKLLAGIPERILQASQATNVDKQPSYNLDLSAAVVMACLSHGHQRDTRALFYQAYTTRAANTGPHPDRYNNDKILWDILCHRHQLAQTLDYPSYADYAIVPKMADSAEAVEDFLLDLLHKAQPQADQELKQLRQYAQEHLAIEQMEAWDMAYVANHYKQTHWHVDQEAYRPYFGLETCLQALFQLTEKLFGYSAHKLASDEVEVWHPSVAFYELRDAQGLRVAGFYLDLLARKKKRGGAWMANSQSRFQSQNTFYYPIAFINCNFSDAESTICLSHQEVLTLFHEFGHGLHHMLTQIDLPSVAGIHGVPWDAVELPSQLMENWLWQPEFLQSFARHVETQEPLPQAMIESLIRSRQCLSALALMRQVELALFDIRIHRNFDPSHGPEQIQDCLNSIRTEIGGITQPSYNRFQNSFNHIFAGGYAAGYYSYKWAEVLSCDIFESFLEEGLYNSQTGQRYLQSILSQGGAVEPLQAFAQFKGRAPSIDALLKQEGILS